MKAMVLAAGIGSRLGEITRDTPKCLVDVGGRTMLELVLERLKAAGVTEVVINLFHKADLIEQYLQERGYFGLDVRFSREQQLLDTGGGLNAVREFFSGAGSFLLHNADVYSDIDLNALLAQQHREDSLAVVAVKQRQTSRYLLFDDNARLVGWKNLRSGEERLIREVPAVHPLAFGGIHAISGRIFNYMEDMPPLFSIIEAYLKAAQTGEIVTAYRTDDNYWIDVGTPAQLEELRSHMSAAGGRPD